MERLRIELFGALRLQRGERPFSGGFRTQKSKELFAFLVLGRERSYPRSMLPRRGERCACFLSRTTPPPPRALTMSDVLRAFGVKRYVDWEARWRSGLVDRKIFGIP